MRQTFVLSTLFAALIVALWAGPVRTQTQVAPAYTASGELLLPSDYREWIFVGTGLGMTYGDRARPADQQLVFDNIYVNPDSYRAFLKTGKWPERTIFVMEGRAAETHQLLANTGTAQGAGRHIEAAVKDSARFPDTGWAYFDMGTVAAPHASAKRFPPSASCYACHSTNTAVENSFVQYYPVLFEAAKRHGTVKPTYDPKKRF